MKFNKKRMLSIALLASALSLPLLGGTNYQAEAAASNRQFVDATKNMGYYIDTSTIEFDSYCSFNVQVEIIRPSDKFAFVYDAHFNMEEHSYTYLNAKVYRYEGSELVSENYHRTIAQDYLRVPPVHEIVKFVLDWQRKHPLDIIIPDPPPPPPPEPVAEAVPVPLPL